VSHRRLVDPQDRDARRGEPEDAPQLSAEAERILALQRSVGNAAVGRMFMAASGLVQRSLGTNTPVDADVVRHDPADDERGWKVFIKRKAPLYTLKHTEGSVKGGVKPADTSWGPAEPDTDRVQSRQTYLGAQAQGAQAFDYSRILTSPGYPRNEFRYWVYYMLEQVTDVERKKQFLQRIFEPNELRTVRPALAGDAAKKQVLHDMFSLGFVSYETLAQEQGKTLVRPGAQLANQIPGETKFGYGFRGDNRGPDKLLQAGGFTTKAEAIVPQFRQSMGFDQPWHPFGDQASLPGQNPTGNAGYFRRGDTDNDLTTIISVTPNFVDATKFPFIQEYMEGSSVVQDGAAQRLRSITHVYLVLVEEGFDTKAAQGSNAFPEIATRTVPMSNVVAVYDIERLHFGTTTPNANDGHKARLLSYSILPDARQRHANTPAWATILRAIETYATLNQLEYKPTEERQPPSAIKLAVNFRTRPGQDLFVAGSIPELGSWNPAAAVPMHYKDENTWELVHPLQLPHSISRFQRFEYKFIVKEKGAVRWEGGPNHDYDPSVRTGTSTAERWHE
jgi:Starch binding domain